jgi:hypothetical protein
MCSLVVGLVPQKIQYSVSETIGVPMNKQTDDQSSPAEIARRRDLGLLSALKTPPKPHSEMVGNGKRVSKTKKSRVKKT